MATPPSRVTRLQQALLLTAAWLLLAAGAAWTAAQLHATLLFVGLRLVESPTLRPAGWTPNTLYGLSRFLWLCLGAAWLMGVAFLSPLLSDARRQGHLGRTAGRLFLSLLLVFLLTYLLLFWLA